MGAKHGRKKKRNLDDILWEEYQGKRKKKKNYVDDSTLYDNYHKNLTFIEGNTINVKVKQKFAYQTCNNYTIPPEYWSKEPEPDQLPKEIEKVESKSLYPYEEGTCGGDTYTIYVYRATKKGTYKARICSKEINVIVT